MDSTELDYTNWNTNNPNNKIDNNCVEMTTESEPDGKWVNKLCQARNIVFCEKVTAMVYKTNYRFIVRIQERNSKFEKYYTDWLHIHTTARTTRTQ